jgi:hypothetical protein
MSQVYRCFPPVLGLTIRAGPVEQLCPSVAARVTAHGTFAPRWACSSHALPGCHSATHRDLGDFTFAAPLVGWIIALVGGFRVYALLARFRDWWYFVSIQQYLINESLKFIAHRSPSKYGKPDTSSTSVRSSSITTILNLSCRFRWLKMIFLLHNTSHVGTTVDIEN